MFKINYAIFKSQNKAKNCKTTSEGKWDEQFSSFA